MRPTKPPAPPAQKPSSSRPQFQPSPTPNPAFALSPCLHISLSPCLPPSPRRRTRLCPARRRNVLHHHLLPTKPRLCPRQLLLRLIHQVRQLLQPALLHHVLPRRLRPLLLVLVVMLGEGGIDDVPVRFDPRRLLNHRLYRVGLDRQVLVHPIDFRRQVR